MTKINTVQKAAKDQGKCGRCGDPLPAGSAYRHASPGFRGRKIVRCMKPQCAFRPSELTTSKMSEVYAAQEDAGDEIAAATEISDLETIMETYAGRVREVAQEYADAADAMGGAGEEMQERADELESHADDVEGFDLTAESDTCPTCEGEDSDGCETCGGVGEVSNLEAAKTGLEEEIGNLSL